MMEVLVREHLRKANTANHDSSVAAIVQESLQHLHIFRPQSQASLQATIKLLQNHFLANLTSHFSANRRLGGIIINSLSAFFWRSRQDAEEEKDATSEDAGNVAASKSDNIYLAQWRAVVDALREAQQTFDCPIIATNWALASPVYSRDGSILRPHLPHVWTAFCTFNFVLQRNKVIKFAPGMSIEEALAEKDQRQQAVDRSGFSGRVNWWYSDTWREETKTAVKNWNKRGALNYAVTDMGVVFDDG